ncbi:ATP-dependent DNA helicase [Desulfurispira natronophila]|uniref:ATP-dependent DNA helicase DinG n=1 Tax=Desulfurispira natronophila TaxID=682562 RepID=A0A7W8DHL2_9BACT|nr:helicase C-terminal domain-containing protein [Desulfurispira natronophila]MBB5022559.1 ATP-dependent DNA helicase DinG [Desulfurispira natronophila]
MSSASLQSPPDITTCFSAEGPLAKALDGFRHRPEQLRMAQCVKHTLDEKHSSIIEAGTGTGKSLAYLVPAISYCLKSQVRLVVSTNTINLQEQLIEKDLPIVHQLGFEFRAALVKGRGNYLCQRKLDNLPVADTPLLLADEAQKAFDALFAWLATTTTGSLNEMDFTLPAGVWEEVCSETDTCLNGKCPYYRDCFFFSARREAYEAQVLVVNHALLCSDLGMRLQGDDHSGIIPAYAVAILDEAHNLEDVASTHLGFRFHYLGFLKNLGRIYFQRGDREGGKLIGFMRRVSRQELPADDHDSLMQRLGHLRGRISAFSSRVQNLGQQVIEDLYGQHHRRLRQVDDYSQLLLDFIFCCTEDGRQLLEQMRSALGLAKILLEDDELLQELQAYHGRLESSLDALEQFLRCDDTTHVRWSEGNRKTFSLISAPLEVGEVLQEALFARVNSTIMTSATLTVNRSFNYLTRRLQFHPQHKLALESPFDYNSNCALVLPRFPDYQDEGIFQHHFHTLMEQTVATIGGGIFVLCTSYRRMQKLAQQTARLSELCGITVYTQGEMPRGELLNRFRQDPAGVLFGVASFWEGVDVQGAALQCVIIEKLPFPVPDDPLFQARCEALQANGIQPFWNLSVPKAVIRLKQGFGRLIRHHSDRGTCIICDTRLLNRRYGTTFLRSLPTTKHVSCEIHEVPQYLLK